jgi:uncharacterized protein YciI
MKHLILTILPVFIVLVVHAQDNPIYDADLAAKLDADEYGMKSYVLVILKKGTANDIEADERKELFSGHQENMRRWVDEGKLIVSGPFFPNEEGLEGIFILDIKFDEAKTVLESDPAIKANALSYAAYPWYGSAALPVYLETHEMIEKIKP